MTLGLGRDLWDVPKTQAIDFGEVITHFPNPQRKTSLLKCLVAVYRRAVNETALVNDQAVIFLVIQTNLSTEPGYEMALLRRNVRLYGPLCSRIFPRSLYMHPGAEGLEPEAAGSPPT